MKRKNKIIVSTDGSCKGNPGPGGWGVTTNIDRKDHEWAGSNPYTTNQKMELTAAVMALEKLPAGSEIILESDSRYVINGATKWIKEWKLRNWKLQNGENVKNIDLWKRLREAELRHSSVTYKWVKGHNNNKGSERADFLAKLGSVPLNREEYVKSLGLPASILKLGSFRELD